ncbi:serine O-acetyltransferase [Gillisia sp. M10.2A]|uniref:Serine acetyltransferase n=1 Tax=Gillisia lutea TaxID=2909668 RepID=A0ABS9EJZ9_9FLAO|nr:serine O-acetyltransferase [Gillisia lutea]MCF4102135.1 serine O-acetyltransferase [Gillisia lutea]
MLKAFRTDLIKYKRYSGKSAMRLLLTQQGLWAILVYRINNSIFNTKLPNLFKNILLFFGLVSQKWIEILTGISLPYSATIGSQFYIGHFGGIIINSKAVIGKNCNISQGVTIGVSGRGLKRGIPVIGNNVYIGANAVIAGEIQIGDNVVVAANSLVVNSVPDNCTVVGVPAAVVSQNNSEAYL